MRLGAFHVTTVYFSDVRPFDRRRVRALRERSESRVFIATGLRVRRTHAVRS